MYEIIQSHFLHSVIKKSQRQFLYFTFFDKPRNESLFTLRKKVAFIQKVCNFDNILYCISYDIKPDSCNFSHIKEIIKKKKTGCTSGVRQK